MSTFRTIPWTNGNPNHQTGSGFGLRIPKHIRKSLFQKSWDEIELAIGNKEVRAPISHSFWRKCNEIRSAEIGKWLIRNGLKQWTKGHPPQIEIRHKGGNRFEVPRL